MYTQLGYEQVTSLSSAVGLTIPDGATYALVQAESQNVRWRMGSTAPTTTVGMVLEAGRDVFIPITGGQIRFIEVAASAKLNVTYYK